MMWQAGIPTCPIEADCLADRQDVLGGADKAPRHCFLAAASQIAPPSSGSIICASVPVKEPKISQNNCQALAA